MKNYVKRFVSIVLCICMLAGMIFTGGGLEALADSMNIGTTDAENLNPKNLSAELGTAENPLTILEIVPSYEMAQIGYFFPGCEPINIDKLKYDSTFKGDFVSGSLSSIYNISDVTVYAFYDQIPENSTIPVYAWSEKYKTREDLLYNETDQGNYGQWKEGAYNSDYKQMGDYVSVGDGKGDFAYNQYTGYQYVGEKKGNYIWVPSENGSTERVANGDLFSYTYVNYEHKNTFLKHVYGLTDEEATNFKAQVITLIPSDLEKNLELIDTVDMITIHGASGDYGGVARIYFALNDNGHTGTVDNTNIPKFLEKGNDLTYNEVIRIVKRMASDNPAALVLDKANMIAGSNEFKEYNCHKLLYMVLSYKPQTFWHVFGDYLKPYKGKDATDKVEYTEGVKTGEYPPYHYWGVEYSCKNWTDGKTPFISAAHPFLFEPQTGECLFDQIRFYNISGNGNDVFDKIYTYDSSQEMLQWLTTSGSVKDIEMSNIWDSGNITVEAFVGENREKTSLTYLDIMKFILGGNSYSVDSGQKLRILEIQPCDEFIYGSDNWKIYYQKIFSLNHPTPTSKKYASWLDDPNLLHVDTMSIWEFIGSTGTYDYGTDEVLSCSSSDDLISKYDLIIIGANQNETNGKNGYNDSSLRNYIYTSVGDRVATSSNKNGSTTESVLITSEARYSAIDITLKKLLELQDFTSAGKPIVVDSGLYESEGTAIDKSKVDKDSKLYQFLNGKDYKDGIFVYDHIKAGIIQYQLTESICRLEFEEGGYPVEYVGDETSGKLIEKYNPSSTLNYKFRIIGGTNTSEDTKYTVYLNTDKNGDGVYGGSLKQLSEVENMKIATNGSDLQVDTSEAAITRDQNLNIKSSSGAVKNGELKANTWYTISYTLPSNQKGIIPWKLEVASVSNPKLRSSAIDYTAIKCSENDKVKINVLQMNLTQDMDDAAYTAYSTYFTNNVVDISRSVGKNKYDSSYSSDYAYTEHSKALSDTLNAGQKSTVNNFEKYLEPVNEFDVNIQFMYNRDWKKLFNGSNEQENLDNWKDFLTQYDMLIFGFQDVAMFTANKVFREGLEDYIEQGKSVIFSHDMVQSQITNKYERDRSFDYKIANRWLRTVTGQRSVTYELKDGVYTPVANSSEYCDNALQLVLRAYSDYSGYNSIVPKTLISDSKHNQYLSSLPKLDRTSELAGTPSKKYRGWYSYSSSVGEGLLETSFVKIANNGQITTYPYNIPDEIEVLQTHVQNYALNLEFIEDGDVNVWYNLTDNHDEDVIDNLITTGQTQFVYNNNDLYSAKSGDSRNNFYIYNKGNITYTGLGHGKSRDSANYAYMTDDEIKLFINTMISAYRQPEAAPYAIVENADAMPQSGSDALFYLEYDETEPSATLDGKIIYEDGKPFLKVQFNLEDDSVNPDISKEYFVYFVVDGEVKEYKLDGFTSVELEVKDVSSKTGKGYKVDKEYVGSDTMLTVYIPYEDIVSKNGQLSLNLCTYAKYFKNGKMVTTTHSKTNVTTMYLPLFNLN